MLEFNVMKSITYSTQDFKIFGRSSSVQDVARQHGTALPIFLAAASILVIDLQNPDIVAAAPSTFYIRTDHAKNFSPLFYTMPLLILFVLLLVLFLVLSFGLSVIFNPFLVQSLPVLLVPIRKICAFAFLALCYMSVFPSISFPKLRQRKGQMALRAFPDDFFHAFI